MNNNKRRKVDLVVVSDVHLGTFGCQAKELLNYLKSVEPKILVLNGDIIDIWQFRKSYWPKSHMKIVKYLASLLSKNTEVYYVTGNHDETLRKFEGFQVGNFKLVNKVVLNLDGKKAWFFHGDIFDITMKNSKWLAKLGGVGYDILIRINTFANFILTKLGREKISLSKKIKNSIKSAIKFIDDFEETAADIAISNGYDYVICGHIHRPQHRVISNAHGSVTYLNSGDWVENTTALEYNDGQWSIFNYQTDFVEQESIELESEVLQSNQEIFNDLLIEFNIAPIAS